MTTFFNDIEPYAADWLQNLFPDATVTRQSIIELSGADVQGFDRVHLFAGIGGWERALMLAGWPTNESVWTGSCPCQPFSAAGKRKGTEDARHLWPEMLRLISECRPPTIFGEQVASKLGREWLARVRIDLEALGYVVGAADLCAASAGAPHIRQRLYWVAYTERRATERQRLNLAGTANGVEEEVGEQRVRNDVGYGSEFSGMDDSASTGRSAARRIEVSTRGREADDSSSTSETSGLGDTDSARSQGRIERRDSTDQRTLGATGMGCWDEFDLIGCADGKTRRIEPGTFPLAHGVPSRVGKLRAYGNAIVPPLAAIFIKSFMEAVGLNDNGTA